MLNFLRKTFIKDYQNIADKQVRTKHGLLAAFVGAVTNLLLFAFKLAIGLITASLSIISDAINNLSDMASCIINIVGFSLSNKPADKEHPFGHQRIEYIAGLIVSFVIIALAVIMGYTAIMKIVNKDNSTDYSNWWIFIILGVSILLKLWQGFFYKKMAKLINSLSLKASSRDSFNDVITTTVVLIAALIQFFLSKYVPSTVPYLYLIDSIMTICVALFIIYSGIKLVIEIANPLIGCTPDPEFVKSIIKDIVSYKGVLGTHDLVVHSYGPTTIFMTIHVEVDSKTDVMESHELIDLIENDISKKYNIVLTIHMDPIVLHSKEIDHIRGHITEYLATMPKEKISYHDLRVVEGKKRTNVLFDLVLPYDSKLKENELEEGIIKHFKEVEPKYTLIVKIDRLYL